MYCNRCGKQNPEGATYCGSCGSELAVPAQTPETGTAGKTRATRPRTSGLAVASIVVGSLGVLDAGFAGLVGLALGVIAFCQINASQGKLRGQGIAIAGIAISAFTVLLCASTVFSDFGIAREKAREATCQANLKSISLGMLRYCNDNDNRFPLRDNWSDSLIAYVGNEQVLRCPSARKEQCGYAYNASLSSLSSRHVTSADQTATVFDAKGGWNLAGGPELVEPRHANGFNVGFVDGHVKWLRSLEGVIWSPGAAGPRVKAPRSSKS